MMSFLTTTLEQSRNFWQRGPAQRGAMHQEKSDAHRHQRWWWILLAMLFAILGAGLWSWYALSFAEPAAIEPTAAGELRTDQLLATEINDDRAVAVQTTSHSADAVAPTSGGLATTPAQFSPPSSIGGTAIVGIHGTNLATSPGGPQVSSLQSGLFVQTIGRTEDRDWILVRTVTTSPQSTESPQSTDTTQMAATAEQTGWVSRSDLVIFSVDALPIMAPTVESPDLAGAASTQPALETSLMEDLDTTVVPLNDVDEAGDPVATTTETASVPVVTDTVVREAVVRKSVVEGVVTDAATPRLNVRAGAGRSHVIIAKAYPNARYTVLARDESGEWLQVALPDGTENASGAVGWVAAAYLQLNGDRTELPLSTHVSTAPAYRELSSLVDQPSAAPASTSSTAAPIVSGLQGTLVFQSSPGGLIYGYDLADGRLWEITSGFDPAISPDGRQVAFVRTGTEGGLFVVTIDGSNEERIFAAPALSAPKWSPDSTALLFTRVADTDACVNLGPGSCIAIGSLPPGFDTEDLDVTATYQFDLARVDRNGDNYRELSALESARAADWHAHGIVYQSSAGLQLTSDQPGATNQLLIHDPLQPAFEDPDWQPNGGQIAFVRRAGDHREIYVVNADGSGMRALTRPETTLVEQLPSNVAPTWSPDGEHIVYLSNRGEDNSAGAWHLWAMAADGSNQRPLGIDIPIDYTSGNEQVVSWGA